MNNPTNELFSRVKIPSEKKRIFKELIENKAEIVIKCQDDNLHFLSPRKIAENRWIICSTVSDTDIQDEFGTIANFAIGNERYFFQTPVQVSDVSVMLDANVELFHLQRRKTMRLILPKELGATCTIINHNHFSVLHECQINDFSKGGIRLSYPHPFPDFRVSDQVTLSIKLGEMAPQFNTTYGPLRREDKSCNARATNSLPQPVSP
jgi:hypothetical protein